MQMLGSECFSCKEYVKPHRSYFGNTGTGYCKSSYCKRKLKRFDMRKAKKSKKDK